MKYTELYVLPFYSFLRRSYISFSQTIISQQNYIPDAERSFYLYLKPTTKYKNLMKYLLKQYGMLMKASLVKV